MSDRSSEIITLLLRWLFEEHEMMSHVVPEKFITPEKGFAMFNVDRNRTQKMPE